MIAFGNKPFWRIARWTIGVCILVLYLWPSPHVRDANRTAALAAPGPWKTQFVDVEPDVALEVLDFGGDGRAIVLLAGLGGSAHSYRTFAPKLTPYFHVYAVTRRGFGNSSWPPSGYGTKRLGDDVAAVINALHVSRPLLVGHSFAGAELSSVAAWHPGKAAGLIYLEAGYGFALDDTKTQHRGMNIARFASRAVPFLPRVFQTPPLRVIAGQEKFTEINGPVLAVYALPHDLHDVIQNDPARLRKAEENDYAQTSVQADAFARQVPQATIIRLPNASHVIYRSNEAEVLAAIRSFSETVR